MSEERDQSLIGHPYGRADWLGIAVFAAAAVSAVAWLMTLGHGLTFFYDEWDFVDNAATTGYWGYVLHSHNGHPSMIPFTVYEMMLHTVGLRHYWPYRSLLILLDVGCGWLLFILLRRKVHPVAAGAAGAALILLGPAWQDLLWPFQIGFLGSVAGGLGALVLLDARSRRSDIMACLCLLVSIGCSGVGLPFAAGIAVELAWHRWSWKRIWIPALPLAVFVLWYETVGKTSTTRSSLSTILHSMADATATTVGALIGRSSTWGGVLSVVLGVLVVIALIRSPGKAQRLAMATAGLGTFWVLTLLARGTTQGSASRYLYPAAALVLIGTAELPSLLVRRSRGSASARHPTGSRIWIRTIETVALVGLVVITGLAIWWNGNWLTAGSGGLASVSNQVRAELDAVTLAGPALPAAFRPDDVDMPQVQAGQFERAAAAFSWPSGMADQTNLNRPLASIVDAMLLRGTPINIQPTSAPAPGSLCDAHPVGPADEAPTFMLPRTGAVVTAPLGAALDVRARALSDKFTTAPVGTISAGATSRIEWSPRSSGVHWYIQLSPSQPPTPTASVTVCLAS